MSKELAKTARSAWKIIPQFDCLDVKNTIAFYVNELGFELGGTDVEPDDNITEPVMCSVAAGRRSDANIYLFQNSAEKMTRSKAMIALGTVELDEYYSLLKQRGIVKIVEEVEDKPWGYRQFAVEDIDGNKIQFFKFLEGSNGEELV